MQGSDPDFIPSLMDVTVQDRQDVMRKTIMHFRFTQSKIDKITEASEKAKEAEAEKAIHVDALNRADLAKAEAEKQKAALEPLKADLVKAQADAKAKEVEEQKAVDAIKAQKSSYTKQINQITADSNALAAEIKKKQNQNYLILKQIMKNLLPQLMKHFCQLTRISMLFSSMMLLQK